MEKKVSIAKKCFFIKCKSSKMKTPEKWFFPVPIDPTLRSQWFGQMESCTYEIRYNEKEYYLCCEDHFDLNIEINYEESIRGNPSLFRTTLPTETPPASFLQNNNKYRTHYAQQQIIREKRKKFRRANHNLPVQPTTTYPPRPSLQTAEISKAISKYYQKTIDHLSRPQKSASSSPSHVSNQKSIDESSFLVELTDGSLKKISLESNTNFDFDSDFDIIVERKDEQEDEVVIKKEIEFLDKPHQEIVGNKRSHLQNMPGTQIVGGDKKIKLEDGSAIASRYLLIENGENGEQDEEIYEEVELLEVGNGDEESDDNEEVQVVEVNEEIIEIDDQNDVVVKQEKIAKINSASFSSATNEKQLEGTAIAKETTDVSQDDDVEFIETKEEIIEIADEECENISVEKEIAIVERSPTPPLVISDVRTTQEPELQPDEQTKNFSLKTSAQYAEYLGVSREYFDILIAVLNSNEFSPQRLMVVLRKIKLNESFAMLGDCFSVKSDYCAWLFKRLLPKLALKFRSFINWPKNPRLGEPVVMDTFEILIEPSAFTTIFQSAATLMPPVQSIKYLICASTVTANINFISNGYLSCADDIEIAREFLQVIPKHSQIIGDKKFEKLGSILSARNCTFTSLPDEKDVRHKCFKPIRHIVDRICEYGMLKPYAKLSNDVCFDDVIVIAAALCNLQSK